jgi:hypothetical protein
MTLVPPARRVALLLAALLLGSSIAAPATVVAQTPSADWRTLELARFRMHYPAPFEAWALRFASRLEAIRDRLVADIGFDPAVVVDVVVADPEASPNGYVIPILGAPRMVVWPTPPSPDSPIGHYRDWGELLAVHEDAHLVQLLRPSRHPVVSLLERMLLPVGPITTQAPRWVLEGYATLLEGELTGMGRPFSDLRAAVLRRWAQQGRLPSYGELSGAPHRWMGQSMAYLAGSAYLEWLRERTGPDSFRTLWARMTARTSRSFEEAFAGVFGDAPDALYGRFAAELARDAMRVEALVEPVRHDGVLWQRFEWSTGRPALSPDGSHLALVRRTRDEPARLVVLATGPDPEAEARRQERIDRMLARDPQDVAPVVVAPPAREPVHILPAIDGAEPHWPRWMPGGDSLLIVRFEPDPDGVLYPDLYRWYPASDRLDRITRGAGLRQPDPAPDGRSAVAIRHRGGSSQLVRVDLSSGHIDALTPSRADVVYDSPRLSPDGRRVVVLRNRGEGWRAVVRTLADGTERDLPVPAGALVAHPAWSADGTLVYLSVGDRGFLDIHALPVEGSGGRIVTRTHGAALGAAPAPGGDLYFLSLESHGVDLRHLASDEDAPARPPLPEDMVAVVPSSAPEGAAWRHDDIEPGRPVRAGRQEWLPLVGGATGPSARAVEIGARGGDVLGRLGYLGLVSLTPGARSPSGAAVGLAWRGWPGLTLGAQAFSVRETASRQPVAAPAAAEAFDTRRRGVELTLGWRRHGRPTEWHAGTGLYAGRVDPVAGERVSQLIASISGRVQTRLSRDRRHIAYGARGRADAGRTGREAWQRGTIVAEGGIGYGSQLVMGTLEYRALRGSPAPFDRLAVGGLPSSIMPAAVAAGRRMAPALPVGALLGDHHRAIRIDLRQAGSPFLSWERHQVRERGGAWGTPISWVAAEFHLGGGPFPLLRLPGLEARTGIARMLGPRAGSRVRWWLGLRWFP